MTILNSESVGSTCTFLVVITYSCRFEWKKCLKIWQNWTSSVWLYRGSWKSHFFILYFIIMRQFLLGCIITLAWVSFFSQPTHWYFNGSYCNWNGCSTNECRSVSDGVETMMSYVPVTQTDKDAALSHIYGVIKDFWLEEEFAIACQGKSTIWREVTKPKMTTVCEWSPLCWDGRLTRWEECDDGNITNGDWCTADCRTDWHEVISEMKQPLPAPQIIVPEITPASWSCYSWEVECWWDGISPVTQAVEKLFSWPNF